MEFESEMKVMKDYHDLHLKCDVLLLVDVSENFRNNSLKNYGLLPCHYLWGPGISWDTTLNITTIWTYARSWQVYIIWKRHESWVSYICNIYNGKANSNYTKSYYQKQESKHIIYLDANNLYDWKMPKFFRTIEFKWIDPK